jgi:Ni/Fe-hydrogenase subunit HybB-like protein
VVVPLVLLSIPWAVGIHTVTAFLYNGMASRPYWNASILAPRFLASAFCSGPAILLVLFQILRRTTKFNIPDEAIWKIAELMAYTMFFNLFLLGAEIFKEFYSSTEHLLFTRYLYFGLHGHRPIAPYAWFAVFASIASFGLFIIPQTRRKPVLLNLGCALIFAGVYIEKGMGLVIPGMTPDTLGGLHRAGEGRGAHPRRPLPGGDARAAGAGARGRGGALGAEPEGRRPRKAEELRLGPRATRLCR